MDSSLEREDHPTCRNHNEPYYVFENGSYSFYLNGVRRFNTGEVAIFFDKECNMVLKHGLPDLVNDVASQTRAQFISQGMLHFANDLIVIQGKFAVEDLNRVVQTTGYIGTLLHKLQAIATLSSAS